MALSLPSAYFIALGLEILLNGTVKSSHSSLQLNQCATGMIGMYTSLFIASMYLLL